MNIQQIEYLIAVSELRSFGKAAERCFITQSTLSTMIARFEEEIGILVFDRKTKPVTITKEGYGIIRQLKVISKEVEGLKELVNELKGEIRGVLKIGVIPTVAPYLLPLFLDDFTKKFPEVRFVISEVTTGQIIEKIKKRDLDIGIVSTPLKQADIVELDLYNEPFLLYDKSDETPIENFKIDEIDYNRLWLLEEGHCLRTQVETICKLRRRRPNISNLDYRSGTIETLMKFVRKTDGVTLLPLLATLDFSDEEKKYLKEIYPPVPVRTIGLVTHKHFVKKGLLKLLQKEILNRTSPLIGLRTSEKQIAPLR